MNDKIYIGKHQTNDLDDDYMGSGIIINKAFRKYGMENFKKEILHIFDNEFDMETKEIELVTEDFCLKGDNYNLAPGGQGGNIALFKSNPNYKNVCEKIGKSRKNNDKVKLSMIQCHESNSNYAMHNKKQTEFQKSKVSNYMKSTVMITDGICNKRILKSEIVPDGWKLGVTVLNKNRYDKVKNMIWITDGISNKRIGNDKIIPEKWSKGRTQQLNWKKASIIGSNNPMFNKNHSEESKKKISASLTGKTSTKKGKRVGIWMNDGNVEKLNKNDSSIPFGWSKGRLKRK